MKQPTINIEGTEYPLKFGFGAFRILGERWNCLGINAVVEELSRIFPEGQDLKEIEFTKFDKIGDIAEAGIINAEPGLDFPDKDTVIDALVFEGQVEKMIEALTDKIGSKKGNPQPRKTAGKKRVTRKKS